MRYVVLICLALLFVPLVLAEDYCVLPDGTCKTKSAYGNTTPPFQTFCTQFLGTYHANPATIPPQCDLFCCCKMNGQSWDPGLVSRTVCEAHGAGTYQLERPTPPTPTADCDTLCGSSSGTGSNKYPVTVSVKDAGNVAKPPLADVLIEYPVGNTIVKAYTGADGKVTISNVLQGSSSFHASKQGCGEDANTVAVNAATNVDFELNCATGGCTPTKLTAVSATPVQTKPQVTLTWTLPTCTNTLGFNIYRCSGDKTTHTCAAGTEMLIGHKGKTDTTFVDTISPLPSSWQESSGGFCYKVKVIAANNVEIDQELPAGKEADACISAMNPFCVATPAPASLTCLNRDTTVKPLGASGPVTAPFTGTVRCGADNRASVGTTCSATQLCSGTSCQDQTVCQKCNGLFGAFVDPLATITGQTKQCKDLGVCAFDSSGFSLNTFRNCQDITTCYDYRSKDACAGSAGNRCGVPGPCEWVPFIGELGNGLCRPKTEPASPSCNQCDARFGAPCTKELCALMGSWCYFNKEVTAFGEDNLGGCRSKNEMACRFYDDRAACEGTTPTPVVVDVTYDASGKRTGGTNAVSAPTGTAGDLYRFQRCKWIASGTPGASGATGYCVKDANGHTPDVDGAKEDDCLERTPQPSDLLACYRDVTKPTTELPLLDNQFIDAEQLRALQPIVRDDTFTPLEIVTWACLAPAAAATPCYPNIHLDSIDTGTVGRGSYKLRYYSEDPAGNLETPIKTITLNVLQGPGPRLVDATVS